MKGLVLKYLNSLFLNTCTKNTKEDKLTIKSGKKGPQIKPGIIKMIKRELKKL